MIIKAGSVNTLADARYFTSKGVDLIGFSFDPDSEYFLAPQQAQEIIKWFEGPKIVGEFGKQPVEEILDLVSILNLDFIQLDWDYQEPEIFNHPIQKILKIEMEDVDLLSSYRESILKRNPEYVLLNIELMISPTSLPEDTMQKLKDFCRDQKVILHVGSSGKVIDLARKINAVGLNIIGEGEEKIGTKSYDELDEMFQLME